MSGILVACIGSWSRDTIRPVGVAKFSVKSRKRAKFSFRSRAKFRYCTEALLPGIPDWFPDYGVPGRAVARKKSVRSGINHLGRVPVSPRRRSPRARTAFARSEGNRKHG